MKKMRIISLVLSLVFTLIALSSCMKVEVAMEYKGETVSANIYSYWLSYYKTSFVTPTNDTESYWNTKNEDGKTNEEVLKELVMLDVKCSLVCQKLFKDMNLSLSENDAEEIDTSINDLIKAHGSKRELNGFLKNYNLNVNMLKEIYENKKKTSLVYETLYAKNGDRVIDEKELDDYFKNNYSRLDMIMIYDTYVYELDDKGNPVFDDTTQSYKKKTLTLEESKVKNDLANDIVEKLNKGESFDSLKEQYNENLKKDVYKDGYYISSNDISVYGKEITAASKELNIGEYKLIDDGEVICIVMRKELVDKAYNSSDYLEQFENILEYCKMADFEVYMKELMVDVKVYEDVISKYPLIDINFITDYSLIV